MAKINNNYHCAYRHVMAAAGAFFAAASGWAEDLSVAYGPSSVFLQNVDANGWSETKLIPRFNPQIGTLTSIELQLTGYVRSNIRVENEDLARGYSLNVGSSGAVSLYNPATTFSFLNVGVQATVSQDVDLYDGTSDSAGASGFQVDPPISNSAQNHLELHPSDSEFAGFIGTGNISLGMIGQGSKIVNGGHPNKTAAPIATEVGADLQVIYFYTTETAAIEGRVWLDADQNGIVNPGEVGIPNVTVTLTDWFGNAVPGVASQTTDNQGRYTFTGVDVPDAYGSLFNVTISQPGPYMPTYDFDDGVTGVPSSPNQAVLFVVPRQYLQEVNFGFYDPNALPPVTASIGDFVWHDVNGNGLQEAGEIGINDVVVTLLRCDGTPTGLTTTTATVGGVAGYYGFSNLPTACYKVQFATPAGYLPSPANQGADDSKDSDAVNGVTGNYLLVDPMINNRTADAGFYQPASLGDFVWNDVNFNGIQDAGESGINGVLVTLLNCDGTPTGLTTTTTTVGGVSGYYMFGDLAPGCYKVQFATPAGYVRTLANVNGTTPGGDSVDSDSVSGTTGNYQLTSGEHNTTADAGFYQASPGLLLTKAASTPSADPFDAITYAYTVLNTGSSTVSNIAVTDDNGTPAFAGDDFTVGTIPTLPSGSMVTLTAQVIPVVSTTAVANGTNVAPGTIIAVRLANGDIKVTYVMSSGVNDNTYGTGSIGWTPSHKFNEIKDTDKLEFRFSDGSGSTVLDFYVDLISAANSVTVPGTGQAISYPSGFGTLGPVGGDGSMVTGSVNNIVSFSTSLSDNLNLAANVPKKASLAVDSPTKLVGGVLVVDAAKAPGGWDPVLSYTVVVKAAAFGAAGFGGVAIPDQMNSPSKLGVTQLVATAKNSTVVNTAKATSGTLSSTATASVDVVVPPGPLPPPCQMMVVAKKLAKAEVQITVTNSGLADIVLTGFNLSWPATSGKLKQVKFDGDVVYDNPDLTSPATVTSSQLVTNLVKRTIAHGTSDVIHLIFEKDGKGDELIDYTGSFTFGTCSVAILPGCNCNLGYPFVSANPLTSIVFNESDILRLLEPEDATAGDTIRVYYNDERALLLGVRNGTALPVSPLSTNPGHVVNPAVGDKSVHDPAGRPIFPALFITDITGIGDNAGFTSPQYRAGDWQFGGTPIPPHEIFGSWKGAVKTGADLVTDADPAKNNWNLGAGSDIPLTGFALLQNEGFGTEIRWNVNDLRVGGLPLQAGHTYRIQVMVHDGDQNKVGGDVGQACVVVTIKP